MEHEIRILKLLRHQSVISLYEIIETPRAIHLIMEYSDGVSMCCGHAVCTCRAHAVHMPCHARAVHVLHMHTPVPVHMYFVY